jgi:hypothetical protein
MEFGTPTAAHFIFIPAVLLIGVVVGWILGSRAAQDAYAAELKRRDARTKKSEIRYRPSASRCARTSGKPSSMMRACAFAIGYSTR